MSACFGNSPVWHGAAGRDHNHAAALLGMRTKEWGGWGYNQLLFDDSDKQLAVQVATTQYSTQLNMGHLRHRADNYRGSFRGTGFEARTDAYGAVRAKQGVMLTTWGKDPATPTGDAAAAQRLMQTARDTGKNLSQAAGTHLSVKFTSDAGVQSGNLSAIRDDQAPLAAMAHALEGMVAGKDRAQALSDAQAHATATDTGNVPHPTDPVLTVAGRGGIGLTATDIQYATGHTHTELAGAHHYTGVAGQTRLHTGQAIGMLGGAIQANDGIGLQLIAGSGDILMQAQSDTLTVASQKDMTISAGQPIDFAAAKKIVIKTAAGATIEIGSAGINVTAPGSFTVHAASHQFVSGGGVWVAGDAETVVRSLPVKSTPKWFEGGDCMSILEQPADKTFSLWAAAEGAWVKGEFAYWLLDRSALPAGWLKNYASNQPWIDLLRGDGFIEDAATPVLVNVQQDFRKFQTFVEIVQRDARYANTVAFITTPMNMAAFQKTLCLRSRIELPQKLEVVLRFFDTRTLPLLPTLFTPEQYALFLKDISAWHYLDRYGELQSLPRPEAQLPENLDRLNSRCVLNVEQEALLIEDGITDAVIDYLITQGASGLHDMLPPEQFDTVSPLVNQARQQGKHDHAEVFEFVAQALLEPVT